MSGLFSGFKKNTEPEAPVTAQATPPVATKDEFGEMKERLHLGAARMKPHFMGNILSALHHLCDEDTERAQETILALFGYLRQSVEGLNRKELLPYSWELGHAQNYLALEELRFEGRLIAEVETDVESFEIPPITLQPLVENAIKHGLAPLERPCHVTVLTRRMADGSVQIQVTDDGAGFDTAILSSPEYEEKSLACIRRRLQREVNGTMEIVSSPGNGTCVTVTLPPQN